MNYPHTCNVYNIEHTKDEYLASEESESISIEGLECWVQPQDVVEQKIQGRESTEITHVMYCPVFDINSSDKIEITKGPYKGITYDVVSDLNEAGMDHHLKVGLKRVT